MQQQQIKKALVWFRNNLRVNDNISLKKAIDENQHIIAVYFFDLKYFEKDNFGFKKTEKFRAQFLIETITNLKQNLANLNITLLTYFDAPENKIPELCGDLSVDKIYTQKEWTREEIETNHFIKKSLNETIDFIEDYDQFLYHPETVSKDFHNIPDIFTGFRKKLEKYVTISEEVSVSKLSEDNLAQNHTEIPTLQKLGFDDFDITNKTAFPFKGGETAASK